MSTANVQTDFASRALEMAEPLREAFASLDEAIRLDTKVRNVVHPSIRSRLSRALDTDNALASLHRMPGPEGLRRVLRAAAKRNVDPSTIARCEESIIAYEQFCLTEDISRQMLRAILANYLPEARETVFRDACQSAYKARSIVAGHHADCLVLTLFIYPGTRSDRCNVAVVRGCRSWRRLRQDCIYAAHGHTVRDVCDDNGLSRIDVHGVPIDQLGRTPLLEQFCSRPLPRFERVDIPHGCNYYLVNDDVGVRTTCTFVIAEILVNSQLRYRGSSSPAMAIESFIATTPCKRAVFDVFIHKDVWAGATPHMQCFNTVPQGPVNEANYPWRQHDRIELGVMLKQMHGESLETAAVKNYSEIVSFMLDRIGMNMGDFSAYRCDIVYPLYGTQTSVCVELPDAP